MEINNLLEKLSPYLVKYGLALGSAILIFIVGKIAARIAAGLAEKALIRSKINTSLVSFTKNIVYFGILIFVLIAALGAVGIQTSSFVALIGAAGLAVGLALQGSLSNFAAGVMIVLFQPFEVGDTVDAGGAAGVVREIQIFSTVFTTADNKTVIVPNSKITADKITIISRR